jgi:hypothetical protein
MPLSPTTRFITDDESSLSYVIPVVVTVPDAAPGETYDVIMVVHHDSDPHQGASGGFVSIVLGGGGAPPAPLTGMLGGQIVPEPSTVTLGMLSAVAVVFFRRFGTGRSTSRPSRKLD